MIIKHLSIKCAHQPLVRQWQQLLVRLTNFLFLLSISCFIIPAYAATDCNQATGIPAAECQSLMELYHSTGGVNWKDKTGWNQTNTPCSWVGITCSAGHVTRVVLLGNHLTGSLPNLNLPSLRYLNLNENQLSGNIPDFNLPSLQWLWLETNQLSGEIPNFSKLPNLLWLKLYSNQLSGGIPDFNNLPKLLWLNLSSNRLSGNIPDFSKLPDLEYLVLEKNQLSGNIPDFSNLPNLTHLILSANQLSGNIPEFSKLPALFRLALSLNQLSGNIPNFNNLLNLEIINLSSNLLSGSIPDFNFPKLTTLYLNSNQLSDRIPNFTAFNLSNLSDATFHHNNCGLIAYNAEQEVILNQKDPIWKIRNSICPVIFSVTVAKVGNGTVSGNGTYVAGTTVNLTAIPSAGYKFVGWSPTQCSDSFVMPSHDLTCMAHFEVPLLATLGHFAATTTLENIVKLQWNTEAEHATAGFNVWRAEPPSGNLCQNTPLASFKNVVQLTEKPIPATGSIYSGAMYVYVDETALKTGNDYCYALEEIDNSGKSIFYLERIISAK